MKQFEQNPVEKISSEKSLENFSEYSPEMIEYLKSKREKFSKYLSDYPNEPPKKIIHGELISKYQKNWFTIFTSIEIIGMKLKKAGKQNDKIDELSERGTLLIQTIKQNNLTTKEQIDTGDEILKSIIEKLDGIIDEEN